MHNLLGKILFEVDFYFFAPFLQKATLKELNEDDESTEFKLCSELALNFGAYNLTKT